MRSYKRNELTKIISKVLLGSSLAIYSIGALSADEGQTKSEKDKLKIERIIVTGTAGRAQTVLESTIAITSMSSDEIERMNPMSAADLLEAVPGFFTEDSAGESNANFSARGTWGDSNRMIGMHNDGVMTAYSDIFTGSLIKVDLMTESVEVVRGGTGGIISSRGPTALVNFISRKGTSEAEGKIKQTFSDFGTLRTDMYYSGPISEDWVFAVGGFYRSQDGVRDRGFKADVGGQLRANLTHYIDDGEITFNFQHVDDKNAFYLPTPMTNKSDPQSIPGGIDALTGTLASRDSKNVNMRSPDGMVRYDLQDGLHTQADILGFDFTKELGNGWTIVNKFKYMTYKGDGNAIFPSGDAEIQLASDRLVGIQAEILDYFPDAVSAQYAYASTGELIPLSEMDAINGNGLTNKLTFRHFGFHLNQVVNNLDLIYETDNNVLKIGSIVLDATYSKLYRDQHKFLAELTDDAKKLDVVALDGDGEIVGHFTSNGFTEFFTEATDATVDLRSISLFFLDEYQVNDDLRVDFGVRWEQLNVDTIGFTTTPGVAISGSLNDPMVMADDTVGQWADGGVFVSTPRQETDMGWSVGANYILSEDISVYGHYTDTFMFRSDLLGEAINATKSNDVTQGQIDSKTELQFFELGLRYSGSDFGASVTLYNTQFTPQAINVTVEENGVDVLKSVEFDTEAWGVEFEAQYAPTEWLTIDIGGVVQNAEYTGAEGLIGGVVVDGNQINRVANEQIRITPTFHYGNTDVYFTYHHLGDRFGNAANTSELPSYATLSAGFTHNFENGISIMVQGSNLTDEVGLSEGNPRDAALQLGGGEVAENFYARSIMGRSITASISYQF